MINVMVRSPRKRRNFFCIKITHRVSAKTHIAGFMSFSCSRDIKIFSFSETCLWCEALLCVGGRAKHWTGINPWSKSSEITIITFGDYEVDLSSLPFINLTAEAICRGEFHRRMFTYCTVYCPTGPEGKMYFTLWKMGGEEERQLGSWWVLCLVRGWTETKQRHKHIGACCWLLASG